MNYFNLRKFAQNTGPSIEVENTLKKIISNRYPELRILSIRPHTTYKGRSFDQKEPNFPIEGVMVDIINTSTNRPGWIHFQNQEGWVVVDSRIE